jgi:hypothetical protein
MVRRIGFRARDLAARLEALRTGFFRRDAVRFVMVGSLGLHHRVRHPCGLSTWRKLESVSCASSRHGNGFFLHLAAASALDLRIWTERSPLPQSLLYGTFQVISLSVNYGIFSALVLTGGLWRSYPVLAAVGSLSPAVISYVLSKWVAFAKPRELAKLPSERR